MSKRCPYCAEEINDLAVKCKHCLSWLAPPGPDPSQQSSMGWPEVGPGKGSTITRLRRPRNDRMVAGVCAAFGRWLGVDPTFIRILVLGVTIFTAILPGIALYFLSAVVIPSEDQTDSWSP